MQAKPEYLDQLMDKARAAAGSDYQLANALGVTRFNVSNWRAGRTPCPVADVALMAEIAGMDPEAWAARAIVAQYEGTPKGEKLARALGKALQVTGAVIVTVGHCAAQAGELLLHTMYRKVNLPTTLHKAFYPFVEVRRCAFGFAR